MSNARLHIKAKDLTILLLPLFFVLHEWNARFAMLNYREMVWPFIFYCLIAGGIFTLCRFFIKDRSFAFFFAIVCCIIFFFFGKFLDLLAIARFSHVGIAVFLSVIIAVIIYRGLRPKKEIVSWGIIFYVLLMVIYLVIEIGNLTVNIMNDRPQKTSSIPANKNKPDVYLLVMDEYASSAALSKYFGHDNHRFDSFLVSANFLTTPAGKSNYNFTMFSMASMLNFSYFEGLNVNRIADKDYRLAYKKIRNSKVQDMFEQAGYDIHNQSCFNLRGQDTEYEMDVPAFGMGALFYQTVAGRLQPVYNHYLGKKPWEKESYLDDYKQRVKAFDAVKSISREKGAPKFVYMHVLAPHPPFFTDSVGTMKISEADYNRSMKKDAAAYTSYLAYCNKKLQDLIATILSNSKGEAVIILAGDHGLRKYDIQSLGNEHHFMNLMAIRLPASYQPAGPAPKTPVNIFPFILNSVFDMRLGYKPDSSVFLSLRAQKAEVSPE